MEFAKIGESVIVRGTVYHYIGRVVFVSPEFLALEDASWLADSGRWSVALATGKLSEVEPYPDGVIVRIPRCQIQDCAAWAHKLPRKAL